VADSSDHLDRARAEADSVLRHDSVQGRVLGQVLGQVLARGARLIRADPRLLDRLHLRVTTIGATVLRVVDGVEPDAPPEYVQCSSNTTRCLGSGSFHLGFIACLPWLDGGPICRDSAGLRIQSLSAPDPERERFVASGFACADVGKRNRARRSVRGVRVRIGLLADERWFSPVAVVGATIAALAVAVAATIATTTATAEVAATAAAAAEATAAAAATAAEAAATAAATAAEATTAASTATTATEAATRTRSAGLSLVDDEGAALEVLTVEVLDGSRTGFLRAHGHETEAARAASLAIGSDEHIQHLSVSREDFAKAIWRRTIVEISDKELEHVWPPRPGRATSCMCFMRG